MKKNNPDSTSDATSSQLSSQKFVLLGCLAVLMLVCFFVLWSIFAPLSSAVIASGVVKAEGNRKTIQHLEGGIIKKLYVKDGDFVEANQILLELSDERVNAGLGQLMAQLNSERTKESRLRAESQAAAAVAWPKSSDGTQITDPNLNDFIAKESQVFRSKRQALDKQIALLQRQSQQVDFEIQALNAQINAITQSLSYAQSELKVTKELADQGFFQKTRVMNLERDVGMQVANIESVRAEASKAQQRKIDLELRAVLAKEDYIRAASEALKETVVRRLDVEDRIRPLADAASRQKVVAPVSGVIVDSRFFAIGAVIGPREPLLDIIPDQASLIIEAKVKAIDSVRLNVGQAATVQMQLAQQREIVKLHAKVTYIAADQSTDKQTGISTFTIHLAVLPESLKQIDGLKLSSGMPAEVFVSNTPRNLLQYLFEPLTAGLARGMRER